MLTFLRKIRRSLIVTGSARKYATYAIGEILLVMVGILLALQVNNWNEGRKDSLVEQQTYHNLLEVLRKDSVELEFIVNRLSNSLEKQFLIIDTDYRSLVASLDEKEIDQMFLDITIGSFSFFPKYGTYEAILSTTGLDIIRSLKTKSKLINYYDYQCKRYENIDKVVDEKYAFMMFPFLSREFGFFSADTDIYAGVDLNRFEVNYDQLKLKCMEVIPWLKSGQDLLIEMKKSVDDLIVVIEEEIGD